MDNTHKTILWQEHCNLGAKMVDFAGYSMPLSYSSLIQEHNAVRTDAGIFDVSHMCVIDIGGQDASKFLSYLLANDVNKLTDSKALYSCLCNNNGGVLDDLIVYKLGNNYRVVVNAATKDKDFAWFEQHSKNFDVILQRLDNLAIISVQGPNSREKASHCLPINFAKCALELSKFSCFIDSKTNWFIARTGYTGEDGFEIIIPSADAISLWRKFINNKIEPCGLGARDTLRLEAGMNLYGQDMDESTSPYESGLGWTVALDAIDGNSTREFIGRDALWQQKIDRANKSENLHMIGLVLEDRGVLRHGQKVVIENTGEGVITSGTFSPTLKCSIAMARVSANSNLKNHSSCQVIIRNKPYLAKIVKYPFVRTNKKSYKLVEG